MVGEEGLTPGSVEDRRGRSPSSDSSRPAGDEVRHGGSDIDEWCEFMLPSAPDSKRRKIDAYAGSPGQSSDRKTTQSVRGSSAHPPQKTEDSEKIVWFESVLRALAGCLTQRGGQSEPLRIASLCSGMAPENPICHNLGLQVRHLFTVDPKQHAFNFCQDNGPAREHHWLCMRELFGGGRSLSGTCALHGMQKCSAKEFTDLFLDILIAGISCKPYSRVRTGRMTGGSSSHKDADLVDWYVQALLLLRPKVGIMENVFGFCMRESTNNPRTPLESFLEVCALKLPDYAVMPVVLHGSVYHPVSRRRLFIIHAHESVGGADMLKAMKVMMQVSCFFLPFFLGGRSGGQGRGRA